VITFSSLAGGKWEHALRGEGLRGASTHFIQTFKKRVFSAEIWAKIFLKMRIFFWKKAVKLSQRQGIRPKNSHWPPAAENFVLSLIDINLSK